MKLPRLFQTSAVRLTLRYTLMYMLVLCIALAALFWSSGRYVDASLEADLRQELESLTNLFEREGAQALAEAVTARSKAAIDKQHFYLLTDSSGGLLAGNISKWPLEADIDFGAGVHNIWLDENLLPGYLYGDDAYLPAIAEILADGNHLLLARGVEQDNLLREVSEYLLESLPAVLVFALLIGVMMSRAMLRRMDDIGRTASEIMAGNLSQRVSLSGRNDEFDALAQRINRMLDRIDEVVASMREVTDNVAHDLRGPITRIRNRMEVTLLEPREEAEYREVIEKTIKDADGMVKTFNAILKTAQANAGTIRADLVPIDLSTLVAEIGELYVPVAEEAGLTLTVEAGKSVTLPGNRDLLAQAIGNLLDNAVKYSPHGGRIDLKLIPRETTVDLVVEDNGPGIPQKEHHRVRERFVRLDGVRQKEGNGLGLSLVDAIARLHGATLLFDNNEPGLRAVIRFKTS
ncbi:MAG: ATP-binding protein [Gammaproteobacteria bacterium]